jgi:hypothetical protein
MIAVMSGMDVVHSSLSFLNWKCPSSIRVIGWLGNVGERDSQASNSLGYLEKIRHISKSAEPGSGKTCRTKTCRTTTGEFASLPSAFEIAAYPTADLPA